jgi:hypothetical protein
MSNMSELHADIAYTGAAAIDTNTKAHIYIRSRMKDAMECWKRTEPKFKSAKEMAQYLARYW